MSEIYQAEICESAVADSYTGLYALYDELVAAHPEYVTMHVLGTDSWGNEVREYVFTTPNYNSRKDAPRKLDKEIQKPVLLVTSGIHGDEKTSVAGGYIFLKALCENKGPDSMATLREAICIKMIPCAVPTGYSNCKRFNQDGVNLNRNFYIGWMPLGAPGEANYGGPRPASECETRLIQNWMEANVDHAFAFLDLHNTRGCETDVTWIALVDHGVQKPELIQAYNGCINSLARHWRQDYGLPYDRNLGYGGRIIAIACAARYANYLGIPSAILESSWQQKFTTDTQQYGPVTNAISAEYFGNLVLRLAKEYL